MSAWVSAKVFEQVRAQRNKLLDAITAHHDQKADDRCILDDNELYAAAGLEPADNTISDPEAMLENCKRFIACRIRKGNWPTYQQLENRIHTLQGELAKINPNHPALQ